MFAWALRVVCAGARAGVSVCSCERVCVWCVCARVCVHMQVRARACVYVCACVRAFVRACVQAGMHVPYPTVFTLFGANLPRHENIAGNYDIINWIIMMSE